MSKSSYFQDFLLKDQFPVPVRLASRLRFDRAISNFDSYSLERRLGKGLLLRHPQASNTIPSRIQLVQSEVKSMVRE